MQIKQDIRILCNQLHDMELKLTRHARNLRDMFRTHLEEPEKAQTIAKQINEMQGIDVKAVIKSADDAASVAKRCYEDYRLLLDSPDLPDYTEEGI